MEYSVIVEKDYKAIARPFLSNSDIRVISIIINICTKFEVDFWKLDWPVHSLSRGLHSTALQPTPRLTSATVRRSTS